MRACTFERKNRERGIGGERAKSRGKLLSHDRMKIQ